MTMTHEWRRLAALVGLIALVLGVFAVTAPDADAGVTGGCTGSADFTADTVGAYGPDNDTTGNPIIVPKADDNVAMWEGSVPGENTNFSGKVEVQIGPVWLEVADWGFPNFDGSNDLDGRDDSGDYNMDEFWSIVEDAGFSKNWIQGIYNARASHSADGVDCEAQFMVKFEGNAFESPIVIVTIVLLVIFLFILIWAGRRKPNGGGFFKGRPVWAVFAAFFLAITIAILLQQFCAQPLNETTTIILPLAMVFLGLVIAKFAPFGGPSIPGGEDGGGTPPIPGLVPPGGQHAQGCDWAFDIDKGAGPVRVRHPKAGAHACCIYTLDVTSLLSTNELAARVRQDVPEVGRAKNFDGGSAIAGVDANTETAVRSWPHGEQGAMHGLGDQSAWPTVGPTPGPWSDYWQERPFEEQPDMAMSTRIDQRTGVSVSFEDGCGASTHEYTHDCESKVSVWGTAECTNENNQPTCPVEITAAALAHVHGEGDLGHRVDAKSLSDPDEIPPKIVAAGPNQEFRRAEADGHRHEVGRERDTWNVADTATDNGALNSKLWNGTIVNKIEADAGMIVPQAMWPTTDRVTAVVEAKVSSTLNLGGESTPGHGPNSVCCAQPGAACACAPSFRLVVGPGNKASLTVDGQQIDLRNPAPTTEGSTVYWE